MVTNDVPPVATAAGLATDQEIMKQALGKIGDTLSSMNDRMERRDADAMRRSQQAPTPATPTPATKVQLAMLAVAILSPLITVVGGGYFMAAYWRGQEGQETRLERIETEQKTSKEERNALKASVTGIERDRASRIGDLDRWRDGVENELRVYRIGHSEFQQMKGVVAELGKKLSDGRDERLRDRETDRSNQQQATERIMAAISKIETQVALLRQAVEGARGRKPEDPFGGENQMWTPPLIDPTRPAQPILKATLSRPRGAARRAGPLNAYGGRLCWRA